MAGQNGTWAECYDTYVIAVAAPAAERFCTGEKRYDATHVDKTMTTRISHGRRV